VIKRELTKDEINNLLRLTGALHIVQNGDEAEAHRATERVVEYVERLAESFALRDGG